MGRDMDLSFPFLIKGYNDMDKQTHYDLSEVTVLKFYAMWCQPCRIYERVFDKVTRDLNVTNQEVNIDDSPDEANKYSVGQIPLTVVLRDGQEVARKVGALRGTVLTELIMQGASQR